VVVLFSSLHTPAVQTLRAVFEGPDFAIRTRSFAEREITTEQADKTKTDTCQKSYPPRHTTNHRIQTIQLSLICIVFNAGNSTAATRCHPKK